VDGLTAEERVLAWQSGWHPSFAGVAIVNSDFTFRSVNPQFCKILGVTPADLLENRFQDITHPDSKKIDERNAKLVRDGKIDFYLLKKSYLFEGGREVKVVLLVTRVPTGDQPFKFFLSRIMLDESGKPAQSLSDISHLKQTKTVMDTLISNGKGLIALAGILGACVAAFMGAFQ